MGKNDISQRIYWRQRMAAEKRQHAERQAIHAEYLRTARAEQGLDVDTGLPLNGHGRTDGLSTLSGQPIDSAIVMVGPRYLSFAEAGMRHHRDPEPVNYRQRAAESLREWGRKRMAEIRAGYGIFS